MEARQPRRPNGAKPHPTRSVRISDELWNAAGVRARQDQATMSFVLHRLIEGYAAGKLNLPTETRTYEQSGEAVATPEPVPSGVVDDSGERPTEPRNLVRVIDLDQPRTRHADPDRFEYAVFEGEIWPEVHNVKDLLRRVAPELWLRDPDRLAATENGREMVTSTKVKHHRYADLPGGDHYLYTGWATKYLLAAAQEFVTAFQLEDEVTVKLLASDEL